MNGFRNYLFSKGIANDKSVKFYQLWVSQYLDFHKSNGNDEHKIDDIEQFISMLGEKYADWQLNQANEAVRAYFLFQAGETPSLDPSNAS